MAKKQSKALVKYRPNYPTRRGSQADVNTLLLLALIGIVVYLFFKVRSMDVGGETWRIEWNERAMIPEERKFRESLKGLLENDFSSINRLSIKNG